jgi:hypothetical protein
MNVSDFLRTLSFNFHNATTILTNISLRSLLFAADSFRSPLLLRQPYYGYQRLGGFLSALTMLPILKSNRQFVGVAKFKISPNDLSSRDAFREVLE